MTTFNINDVPDNMVLIQYIGENYGTTLWGGPGGAPSGRFYTFGAGENDRIKHVDQRDVEWFLNQRENKQTLFVAYQAPEEQPVEPEEGTPLGDAARDFGAAGLDATKEADATILTPDLPIDEKLAASGLAEPMPELKVEDALAMPLELDVEQPESLHNSDIMTKGTLKAKKKNG